ncbi:hypothetical protein VCUG_02844 [Vavraia culicis subsp. floridensis]|uniref:Uncharacterized protein n=1 Tax=Vavraia culicis (isolate floridensis) TaxID=948595 RepID=A0A024RE38_VAVCU|nr:uncharacterized protein VCUG_02844 [Vavraia culicis subsp. floridensis]ETA55726.1 hypothetical protein VCUG_02844 [Vavraia culicis subsp. floridensis]
MKHFKSRSATHRFVAKSGRKDIPNNTRVKLLDNCVLNDLEGDKESEESDFLSDFVES